MDRIPFYDDQRKYYYTFLLFSSGYRELIYIYTYLIRTQRAVFIDFNGKNHVSAVPLFFHARYDFFQYSARWSAQIVSRKFHSIILCAQREVLRNPRHFCFFAKSLSVIADRSLKFSIEFHCNTRHNDDVLIERYTR